MHAVMDKSADGESIGNTMTVRQNLPENREQLQKVPLYNLMLFNATGPSFFFEQADTACLRLALEFPIIISQCYVTYRVTVIPILP